MTIVTVACFIKAGTYVLVDVEEANRPPNCLPVTKDENGRVVDFALETTRLNAWFEHDFAIMCITNVLFQPDVMVTRPNLVFGPPRLDPSPRSAQCQKSASLAGRRSQWNVLHNLQLLRGISRYRTSRPSSTIGCFHALHASSLF